MKSKTIALLGSTGSIGESTLSIIKKTKTFKVVFILANSNYSKILSQIKIFKPKVVVINDLKVYLKIKKINKSNVTNSKFLVNKEGNIKEIIHKLLSRPIKNEF